MPLFDRTAEELDRKWVEEIGNDMQQRVTGWNRTPGRGSKDTASVNRVSTLPTGLPGHNRKFYIYDMRQSLMPCRTQNLWCHTGKRGMAAVKSVKCFYLTCNIHISAG